MKKTIFFGVIGLLMTSCFMGTEPEIILRKITSDFWLWASVTDNSFSIIRSTETAPQGGTVIVEENIVGVWFNNDFIIARSNPNYQEIISKRLFGNPEKGGDYLLKNAADTIYLSTEDSIYQKDGNWFHTSNGWNPPDSLNPYEAINYYHIIDLRNYKSSDHTSYAIYKFMDENEFITEKIKLNIPADMSNFKHVTINN